MTAGLLSTPRRVGPIPLGRQICPGLSQREDYGRSPESAPRAAFKVKHFCADKFIHTTNSEGKINRCQDGSGLRAAA